MKEKIISQQDLEDKNPERGRESEGEILKKYLFTEEEFIGINREEFLKKIRLCNPEIVYKRDEIILGAYFKEMEEVYESFPMSSSFFGLEENQLKEILYQRAWHFFCINNDYFEKVLKNIFKVENYSGIINKEKVKLTLEERLAKFKLERQQKQQEKI